MIDTHAHLESCAEGPDEAVSAAAAAGVSRILTIGREQALGSWRDGSGRDHATKPSSNSVAWPRAMLGNDLTLLEHRPRKKASRRPG